MISLRGSVQGAELPTLVHMVSCLRLSGCLEVTSSRGRGELLFDEGLAVGACYASQRGLDAVALLALAVADGEFAFDEGDPNRERTMRVEAKDLIQHIRGALAVGEELNPLVSSIDSLPRIVEAGESPVGAGTFLLDRSAVPFLMAIDGHRTIFQLMQLGPPVSIMRALAQLVRLDLVRIDSSGLPGEVTPTDAYTPPARTTLAVPTPAPLAHPGPSGVSFAEPPVPWEPGRDLPPLRRRPQLLLAGGALLALALVVGVALLLSPALQASPAGPIARVAPPAPAAGTGLTPGPGVAPTLAGATPADLAPTLSIPVTVTGPPAATGLAVASPSSVPSFRLRPVIDTGFADPAPDWLNQPPVATWIQGTYKLSSAPGGNYTAVAAPIRASLDDVVVTVMLRKLGGPPEGSYGIIVRDQSSATRDGKNQFGAFYVFEANGKGEAGVWRRDGDRWVELVPWTAAAAVRTDGSANELVVLAFGDQLAFLVNGTRVAATADATLAAGGVGVFAGGDLNEVAVDHITVRVPE